MVSNCWFLKKISIILEKKWLLIFLHWTEHISCGKLYRLIQSHFHDFGKVVSCTQTLFVLLGKCQRYLQQFDKKIHATEMCYHVRCRFPCWVYWTSYNHTSTHSHLHIFIGKAMLSTFRVLVQVMSYTKMYIRMRIVEVAN